MKREGFIEIPVSVKEIGVLFCDLHDTEQGEVLNSLGRSLVKGFGDAYKAEMQVCYLSDKLDADGIWLIEQIADFIKIRKEKKS